ncbi:MAG: hypothetical protein AAGC72_16850 [Planctomycetota bacterium]
MIATQTMYHRVNDNNGQGFAEAIADEQGVFIVHFDRGTVLNESEGGVDRLIDMLNERPGLYAEIATLTDELAKARSDFNDLYDKGMRLDQRQKAEIEEEKRLNGMGMEREAKLKSDLEAARRAAEHGKGGQG